MSDGPVYDRAVKELCAIEPAGVFRLLGLAAPVGVGAVALSEAAPAYTRQADAAARAGVLRAALDLVAEVADDHVRSVLAHATVDLAGLYLDPATIASTWEDSAMPIPSFTHQRYLQGREEASEQHITALLRARFGDDDAVPAAVAALKGLDPDTCTRRILDAGSIGELVDAG